MLFGRNQISYYFRIINDPSTCFSQSSPEYRAQLVEAQGRSIGKRKSYTPNKIIGESSKTVLKNTIREEWFCPICEGPDNRIDDGEA